MLKPTTTFSSSLLLLLLPLLLLLLPSCLTTGTTTGMAPVKKATSCWLDTDDGRSTSMNGSGVTTRHVGTNASTDRFATSTPAAADDDNDDDNDDDDDDDPSSSSVSRWNSDSELTSSISTYISAGIVSTRTMRHAGLRPAALPAAPPASPASFARFAPFASSLAAVAVIAAAAIAAAARVMVRVTKRFVCSVRW
jgi:hypothetical protein